MELMILLPQPLEYWDDSYEPPYMVGIYPSVLKTKYPKKPIQTAPKEQDTATKGLPGADRGRSEAQASGG